jgi:hypothetical protein
MERFRSRAIALAILVALLPACGGAARDAPAPPSPETAGPPASGDPGESATAAPEATETRQDAAAIVDDPSIPKPPPLTPLGVPECDKFIEKYVACVDRHVPVDEKEKVMRELYVHRVRWLELEKMQDGKLAAGLSCRGVAQRLKGDMTVDYGCEF